MDLLHQDLHWYICSYLWEKNVEYSSFHSGYKWHASVFITTRFIAVLINRYIKDKMFTRASYKLPEKTVQSVYINSLIFLRFTCLTMLDIIMWHSRWLKFSPCKTPLTYLISLVNGTPSSTIIYTHKYSVVCSVYA